MERWVGFAFLAMFFAGLTAVLAKHGLQNISGEMGLTIRTCLLFVLTLAFAAVAVPRKEFALLTTSNYVWLGISAVTTFLSWLFYYKALAQGDVTTVALIDKGSFIVAVVLAWLWLGEPVTLRAIGGMALISAGLAVVAWK